jgi:hypothetical protein
MNLTMALSSSVSVSKNENPVPVMRCSCTTELAEVFPVDLKLDYKPRRVDYRALREGRTIELMNFFHFDGAEMTLRHITLAGVCSMIHPSVALLIYRH